MDMGSRRLLLRRRRRSWRNGDGLLLLVICDISVGGLFTKGETRGIGCWVTYRMEKGTAFFDTESSWDALELCDTQLDYLDIIVL